MGDLQSTFHKTRRRAITIPWRQLCDGTLQDSHTRECVCMCASGVVCEPRKSVWPKCTCARAYAFHRQALRAQTSGLCTSECWHQIRLFIITATLITREDSGDRPRLRKHRSAERRWANRLFTHAARQPDMPVGGEKKKTTQFPHGASERMGNESIPSPPKKNMHWNTSEHFLQQSDTTGYKQ